MKKSSIAGKILSKVESIESSKDCLRIEESDLEKLERSVFSKDVLFKSECGDTFELFLEDGKVNINQYSHYVDEEDNELSETVTFDYDQAEILFKGLKKIFE